MGTLNLITDRTQADVLRVEALSAKGLANMTDEEKVEWLSTSMKGAYNYTDLNRVNAAMDYLAAKIRSYGNSFELKKMEIPHKKVSRLPEGFTELAYIEATGTQHVDTEFVPNQDTRVVFDGEYAVTSAASWLFGVRVSSGNSAFAFLAYSSKFRSDYRNSYNLYCDASITVAKSVDKNKNITVVNDSETLIDTYGTFDSQYSLALFAINTAGTISGYASAKLKSLKIYDNSTLVRDYKPCRNPNGEVGLYDLVTEAFFGNSGTGVFLAGPPRVVLPEGYTQVEYLESSGTQHIDIGFKPDQNTKVVVDVLFTTDPTTHSALFGARNSNADQFWAYYRYSDSAYSFRYASGSDKKLAFSATTRAIITADNATMTVNDQTIAATSGTFTSAYNMFLFAVNNAGAVQYPSSNRIYSCQTYDNGTCVRDFVPCKDSAGTAGLYDVVNAMFYTDAAGGTFAVGSVVEWQETDVEETRDPYLWYEDDIPTVDLMQNYLDNVRTLRGAMPMPANTPSVPADMEDLTVDEANHIEVILSIVEVLLINMSAAWFYSGQIFSGEV